MEEGFNNANNPFGVTNGSTTDNIIQPRSENLLLNTDKFKQNGTDVSPPEEFFEKSNGKRRASEFDDDDEFGPETDVDTVDDLLSPGLKDEVPKSFADGFPSPNNNPLMEGGVFNPFMEHQEKAALEMEKNMRKRETRDLFDDDEMIGRDETPTPPADAVHDVSGLVDSESDEDEWNYIKGEEANKENISPQPEKEVADIPEEDDTMSQLNPNAAEFVPVSPTRSIPSPACRMLINDPIVSQSPKKANDIDISLPNPKDFEREVKSRPSEVDSCNNGHKEDDDHNTSMDLIENILNGKNIDEIPEFQPGSTPKKVFQNEEFHFGPNAAPFSPKLLDQSEALSTKALFGDESSLATVDTSFNESASQDLNILNKESDPMSMSIYADKGESNPFDLDKVQQLPDDLDEFLKEPDNDTTFNETISDLPDHCPLEDLKNNDDILKTTDIDKPSYDDEEKELASPLETEKELINSEENLLEEFCHLPQKPQEFITNIISDSSEVSDLLRTGPENIPAEVELLPTVDLQPFENLSDSNVGLSNVSSERILDSNAESSEKLSDSNIEISNISSEQFRDSSIDISHLVPEKLSDPSVEDSTLLDKSDANIEYLPTEPKPVFNLKSTESSNPGFETESETFEGLQDAVSARSEQLHVDFSAFERPESIPSVCDLEESKSPMPEEPMSAGSEDFTRPEFIQQAQDRFEDLCKPLESPQEEITSSVKDDLSEEQAVFDIAKFASQDEIVKDTFVEKDDVNDIVLHEAPVLEEKEFVKEEAIPPSEPQEELLPLEISSPKLCVCPPKLKEEPEIPFDIKTENISPEFAESAIVTPSEESKTEELIVAQSKNTHSTDNKNVKPLKANVPKVLHDNFEQPRKIRPQVTDYLKNELPICAVLENQDILQDKTTLVPRTFSEKFKCEMPLITSTKSKSKTKISDVCPLSDPISTNLIPKPILDTFKLIMPQTPLASAIAMENKMQKLITPAMGEFNEELRKEHLNDSEMCKSPIDQLKPENIKDQLKCKSLNFIEKELKTLEKGRLMDKASIGKLSALFNQKTEQEIESFDKQTKQICNELVAELSKIVSESNSSKSSVCGNSKYIRPFEIVPEKCLVGDKSESTKSKAKLVLKSELVCSQHVSSVCGCIKSVPNISNIESVHEYTKLNKEFSDLQIKSPILTLGEIYQELQNKKHTSNTDSRITSNLSKDLVKIIDNHLYQTVSNNSGIPQNYDELKIELHSAIHDTEENVDELISEETINTLFLKPRVFDAENSELFVNKNNYYRPDYNYSCLLHDTEQKEDSSLDVKTELIHTENQLACDYSYRLPTGTDQKDSSSDVETESVLFPTFKKQLEGKEKESWSNNKSESHLRKEVHFVSSTCEQVLGQSTKSDEKKVRFSKTEIVCSPSYETQSSEISAQCSVNISAFEEQKDFSSGDKTKSDLKISILVCGKPEVFNDSENVESVLSKDVHLITPKSIPNKICVTNKSYDDSLGVNNQPDSYSYSSQSSEEQKNDDTESTYSLEFLVEDHYVPVCDYSYIPDFIDHNNVRNITNNAEVIIDDSYQLLNDYSYLITFGKHKQEEEVKNDNVESTQDIHCPNCVDSYHMNVEEYIQGNELKHDNIESFMEGISSSVCDYLYVINFKERKQEIYNKNDNVESLSEVIYHPVCDYSFLPTFEEHNQENEPKNNYVESLTEDIYQPVCDYSYHPSFEEYKQENESNKGYVDESLTESCYPVCDYSHPPTFEEQKQEKEPEEENVEFLNEGIYNPVCDYSYSPTFGEHKQEMETKIDYIEPLTEGINNLVCDYSYLPSFEEQKQEKEPEEENFEFLNEDIYIPVSDYSCSPTLGEYKQEIETKIESEGINNPICDYSYLPPFEEHKQEKESEEENFEFLNESIYIPVCDYSYSPTLGEHKQENDTKIEYIEPLAEGINNPVCDYSCSPTSGDHKQGNETKIEYIEPLAEGINNLVCDYSYLPSFEEQKQEKEPEEKNFEFLNEDISIPVSNYSYSPTLGEHKQENETKIAEGINNPVCDYSCSPTSGDHKQENDTKIEYIEPLAEGMNNPVCDYSYLPFFEEQNQEKKPEEENFEFLNEDISVPVSDYLYSPTLGEHKQENETKIEYIKPLAEGINNSVCDYSCSPTSGDHKQEKTKIEYIEPLAEGINNPVCDYSYLPSFEEHKEENEYIEPIAESNSNPVCDYLYLSSFEEHKQEKEPEKENFEIHNEGLYNPVCDYSYLSSVEEHKQEKEPEKENFEILNGGIYNPVCDYSYSPTFGEQKQEIETKIDYIEPLAEGINNPVCDYSYLPSFEEHKQEKKSEEENFEFLNEGIYNPICDYSCSLPFGEHKQEIKSKIKYIEPLAEGINNLVCDYSYLPSFEEHKQEKEPEEDNFEFLNEGIYNPVCDYSYSPIHLEYKQETKPKNDYIEPLTKGINNPVCNYSHLPIFEEQEKSAEENYEFLNEGVYNPVCDYLKTKERRHEKDSSNDDYGEYHTQCIQPVCHYENEYFTDSNYHPVCDYSYQLSIEEQEQDKEPIFKSYIQDIYHPVCDYSYTPPLEYKQENDSLHEYETIYQPVCDYSYIFPIEQHKQENDLENDSAQDAVIFTETATVGKKVNFVQNSDEPIETKDQVIEPEIVCTKVSKKLEDFEISIVKGSYQPICDYSYLLPTLEEKQEKESASGDKSESKLIKLVNFDKEADTIQTSKLKTDEPSQENKLQMSKLVIVYTLRSDVSNDLKNNKSSEIKDANNYKPVYDYSFSVHTSEEHEEEFSIGGTYKPVCDYSYLLSTLEEQKEGSLSGAESNPILTSKDPNISSDPEHNSKMPVSDNTHNLLKFLGNKVDGIATIECISDALAKKKNTEEFLAENVDQHTSEELTKCENDKVLNVNQNITSDVEEPEKEDNNVLEYTNMSQLAESELVNRVAATNECANPEVVPMSILLPDDLKFELISSDKREDNIPEKPICKEIDNKKMEKEPHLSPVSSEEHPTCVYDLSKHIDSAELHEGPLSTEEVQKITELATETTAETLKLKSSELSIDILNGHKPKSQTRDKLELCVGDKPNQTKSEKDIKKIKILYPGSKFMETYNPSSSLLQGNLSANPDSSSISQETLDKFLVAFRQKLVEILVSALLNFKIALVEEMKNIKGINSDALLSHVIENVQANNTRLGNVIEWILSEDDEPAKEQLSETQEIAAEMTAIGVASTIAAGAALTAVLSDTKPKEEEKHEVKESDAVKKTPLKTTPSKEKNLAVNAKSSAKSPAVSSKALPKTGSATTTPKLSARSSKAPTPKTGPTKTSPAATKQLTPVATTKHSTPSVALKSTPKTSLSKTPTKPQPIKSTEKITNGETKTSARPPITRKPAVDPMSKMNSKSTTSTSAPPSRSNVSKFGAKPQQITVTKAPVPPRITPPTSARPISSTTRRAPATTKLPTGTTTEKPTSLGATKPLATARAAPKPAPAVPLKLKPSTTAPTKPRVPLSSKPISKVQPDTEKQIKDSANKITASRSVTQKTGATSARTASSVKNVTSTIHKAETKVYYTM
ncbi:unnamed protein product [Psylliodes chrysocephalus]|uniref:Uncharacterized protein n=1 Tax=Psylliodes chrysocephalus TaxID=3402493 RepID=A0A9P0CGZ7_9CUCU|nr:unnamed protein product [Psylliodes chrysocephala]